ncbi:MAG TPA: MBL fold metallo-hydrolase [Clostridia bacterium]|nr:MBL fold metallo-hydrolase [Clostridia bacterium]
MSLRICSFSSGSKGNCSLISNGHTHILVDAGISFSRLKKSLAAVDLKVEDIAGVVITHEHSDHICGLNLLAPHTVVYAHEKTAKAIEEKRNIKLETLACVQSYDTGFAVGDIFVMPFRLPHDAVYPLGYSFYNNGQKISVATDIGHITSGIVKNLSGSNIILLEANHDVDMLKQGSYAEFLKRRILGENGHLSNDKSAEILGQVLSEKLERVILAHLSQENNLAELAYSAAAIGLKKQGVAVGKDVQIEVAAQFVQTPCFDIKRC